MFGSSETTHGDHTPSCSAGLAARSGSGNRTGTAVLLYCSSLNNNSFIFPGYSADNSWFALLSLQQPLTTRTVVTDCCLPLQTVIRYVLLMKSNTSYVSDTFLLVLAKRRYANYKSPPYFINRQLNNNVFPICSLMFCDCNETPEIKLTMKQGFQSDSFLECFQGIFTNSGLGLLPHNKNAVNVINFAPVSGARSLKDI